MRVLYRGLIAAGAIALAVPMMIVATDRAAVAADHLDPPARTDPDVDSLPDKAADIADVYTWHTATDLVVAMTFAGPQSATLSATYDRDMLYTINISNERDPVNPTFPIRIRFGRDAGSNSFGVQLENVPGAGTISGPVETILEKNGVKVRAGLYDDPFFFDLQGFRTTRSTGTLAFDNKRSFFTGQNLTAVVIQIPRTLVAGPNNKVRIWADSARIGGQI